MFMYSGKRGRTTWVRALIGSLAAFAATGCGTSDTDPPPAGPAAWVLDANPVLSLGDDEAASPHIFSGVTGLALLEDGGVVVAEASGTLRFFEPDGSLRAEAGGEGQGPGEFAYLSSLHSLRGDTLLAYDPVAYRLTTFDRSGGLLATTTLVADGGAPELYLGRDSQGQHVVSVIHPEPRDASRVSADRMELRRYATDGDAWESLGFFPGMRRVRSPVPFSPHLLGAVAGTTVVTTDGLLPPLTALENGGKQAVHVEIATPLPALSDARARIAASIEDDGASERLAAAWEGPQWDSIPHFSDLLADPEGRLWLKAYDPGTDSHWVNRDRSGGSWTIVSHAGELLAVLEVQDDFRVMTIGGGRVAGVSRDSLGVERIRVYAYTTARNPAA